MNFSKVRPFRGCKTVTSARDFAADSASFFRELCLKCFSDHLNRRDRIELGFLLGEAPGITNLHASNTQLREKAAKNLIDQFLNLPPGTELKMVTIFHEGWETDERSPILDLADIQRRTAACFKYLGFEGIGFLDMEFVSNQRREGLGRKMRPHIHALGVITGDDRSVALNASGRLSSSLGAPPVKVKSVKASREDIAMVVAYCLKCPHRVKYTVPSKLKKGSFKTRSRRSTKRLAARLLEVASYLAFSDLIVTRGRWAWVIRQALLSSVGANRPNLFGRKTAQELDRFWSRAWSGRPVRYKTVQIIRRVASS